jgi:hypothetical protein
MNRNEQRDRKGTKGEWRNRRPQENKNSVIAQASDDRIKFVLS